MTTLKTAAKETKGGGRLRDSNHKGSLPRIAEATLVGGECYHDWSALAPPYGESRRGGGGGGGWGCGV